MIIRYISAKTWLEGEPIGPAKGGVFIAWKTDCHRSSMTARCFGTDLWLISPFSGNSAWRKILRYMVSLFITNWLLFTRRPVYVFLLNQPMPLALSAAVYGAICRVPYVLDCHSNAYSEDRASLSSLLYKRLTGHALFNINHNRDDGEKVLAVGGRTCLIPEIPGSIEVETSADAGLDSVYVLVVCSYMKDEPIGLVFEAAELMPNITFYLTGDHRKLDSALAAAKPANIEFLGFVARDSYLRYFVAATVIVTLSSRPHIMQMAAEEALCLAIPLVSNKSGILEEVFGSSALFVELDARRLARAIGITVKYHRRFQVRMSKRRDIRRDNLRNTLRTIGERQFAPHTVGRE